MSVVAYALADPSELDRARAAVERAFETDDEVPPPARTYFDTFDQRLLSKGGVLCVAPDEEGVAIRWEGTDGRLLRRATAPDEVHFADDIPPGPLHDELASRIDVRRLLALAHAEAARGPLRVLDAQQKTVVRIAFERWTSPLAESDASTEVDPPPEADEPPENGVLLLWVRPLRGYEKWGRRVCRTLESEARLSPLPPRPGRGLWGAAAHWVQPPPSARADLRPDMRADEALKRLFLVEFAAMRRNEEGTRQALDPEFLHDFRVAVRRTRTGLARLARILPEQRVRRFKREFRWLGGVTGPLRDMDVYLSQIPAYERALLTGTPADLEPLRAHFERRRDAARDDVQRALSSATYRTLVEDWGAFLRQPAPKRPRRKRARRPVIDIASRTIAKTWRRVVREGRKIREDSPADDVHELRLDCKKLRYLLEFFRELYEPDAMRKQIRELKRLQENLGDFNDFDVQQGALREAAEELAAQDDVPHGTLMAIGQLVESLARRQQAAQAAFAERFARFASRRNLKRARKLFGPGAEVRP